MVVILKGEVGRPSLAVVVVEESEEAEAEVESGVDVDGKSSTAEFLLTWKFVL